MRMLTVAMMSAGLISVATIAPHAAMAAEPANDELLQRLQKLSAEMESIKAELNRLTNERAQAAAAPQAEPSEPPTVFTGYGEINYNRPIHAADGAQADVRRAVLGFQHRFDADTRVVGEFEYEHAVVSATDPGEAEVEQAYVEHQISPKWALRAGLFLIPMGLLNENHEPTAYYGVERNFVETAIIPSTWREGGFEVLGNFDNGFALQGGVSTGFDISRWDATSKQGAESPLGSIHQELALAKARDLSFFGALNWRGVPGVQVGGGIFAGQASQGQPGVASVRVTLWDLHSRWTHGPWDLAAIYARGTISNSAAFNAALVGNPTLVPNRFDGWYVQAAFRAWQRNDKAFKPFVRLEQFNTARGFDDIGQGLTPAAARTEQVLTVGGNFQLAQGVVFKADYQRFREAADGTRVNLGVGWGF